MSTDGMNYAPDMSHVKKVVAPGDFYFAASHFDHGHIFGQVNGLANAGGILKTVYDPDPSRCETFLKNYPEARVVSNFKEILDDPEIKLITSAAIPNERCGIGLQVMNSGKDYLTDKCPFTSLTQLEQARKVVAETGRKYMVCYSERLSNESAWHAGELIRQGAIGQVLQVLITGPHNLAAASRPDWFFQKKRYGGILTDIASHQFDQFLYYADAQDAEINFARVENFDHPEYPELEDFGEVSLTLDTGASAYCRMDWFNPGGSKVWGDGRTFILGTKGYMEVRKYIDLCTDGNSDIILLVDEKESVRIPCKGRVGFPYFGRLILDVLNRTENAMTQEHAFKAAELSMKAQAWADAHRN